VTALGLFHSDLGPADAPAVLLVHGWGDDGREWSTRSAPDRTVRLIQDWIKAS
jgi:pimeloyl-ACP methyl ester carboxylesterase